MTALEDPSQLPELKRLLKRKGRSPAKRVRGDGHLFDSRAEHRRYLALKALEAASVIDRVYVHKSYEIVVNGVLICNYVADFVYWDRRRLIYVVEDVKPPKPPRRKAIKGLKQKKRSWTGRTPEYEIKKRLMLACHSIQIQEVSA